MDARNNAWNNGARFTVGPGGVRSLELGLRVHEDTRKENERDTAFVSIRERALKAIVR